MLLLTLGDPHSINIEICYPLLSSKYAQKILKRHPIVIIGSLWQWRNQCERLELTCPELEVIKKLDEAVDQKLYFLDLVEENFSFPAEQLLEKDRGNLATQALYQIPRHFYDKTAVITLPIDKHACHNVGFDFPGQTEYFSHLWDQKTTMILAGPMLKVGLVTNHMALKQVSENIHPQLIKEKINIFAETLQKIFGLTKPRIAVCGLNPHCGENGLFGSEDKRVIQPALETLENQSFSVSGPAPADTVFYHALKGDYDGVLAMYHDQGLAPLKTVHFEEAINISGGLPYLRLSCDHGPAKDIFLKKKASSVSLEECFKLAATYLFH